MALFPKIETHCPYGDRVAEIVAGDFCRLCKRRVVDLTAMDDIARAAFVTSCSPETCVTYRLPVGATIVTAAALAGMAMPLAAAAQDKPTKAPSASPVPPPSPDAVEEPPAMIVTGTLVRRPLSDVPVVVVSADDLFADDPDRRPGVIDLIRKLFRGKR